MKTLNTDCCRLVHKNYKYKNYYYKNKPKKKGGIILVDSDKKKFLIVQSNGSKWGIPKGSIDPNETIEQCAIREVYEETGLLIPPSILESFIQLRNRTYFISPHKMCGVIANSDATGIGWVCYDCIEKLAKSHKIELTKDCLLIINKLHEEQII